MSRNSRQFAIVVSVLVLYGLGFTARRIYRSPPVARDDAFLSYWQCADGLATALAQVKSNEEFAASHPKIGDPDPESGQSIKDVCDDLRDQLDAFRAAFERMPENEVEEAARHSDLVKRVKEAIANLNPGLGCVTLSATIPPGGQRSTNQPAEIFRIVSTAESAPSGAGGLPDMPSDTIPDIPLPDTRRPGALPGR